MSLASKLDQYLIRTRGPFHWEKNNCCQFAARWVAEVEGSDPMSGLPSTSSPLAARRLIRKMGGIAQAITQCLKREPLPSAFAGFGDIVLYQWAEGKRLSVGICAGRTSMLIDETGAGIYVPTLECTHAWRVQP